MKKKGDGNLRFRRGTYTKNCPTLVGIINNIAAKKRIPPSEVEEILEHYHDWVVQALSSETTPNISVPNFGRFNITAPKIRLRIIKAIKAFRDGQKKYENLVEIIKRYYPVYKRAHFEGLLRGKGINRNTKGIVKKSINRMMGKKVRKNWIGY